MLCFACLAVLLALPGSAAAAIGVESFSLTTSTAQAGAHPDLNVTFAFEEPGEPETAQAASVELPRGFFFYPGLMVRCTANQFAASECPIASQVGIVTIHGSHEGNPDFELGTAPVYMRIRGGGELARFAFVIPTVEATVEVPVVTGAATGYSPVLRFEGLPAATPIASIDFELWGVPAAPAHDDDRFPIVAGGRPSNVPQEPFTRNPTACGETSGALDANSYEDPSHPASTTVSGPSIAGCEKLGHPYFLEFTLGSTETATATGLEVELQEGQSLTPTGLSSPDLESALTFLNGLEVNEAADLALSICSHTQAHLDDDSPAECPAGSKIGTLTATVAGTEDPLEGSVYLGPDELSGDHQIFLVLTGAGIELKVPARLHVGIEIPELPQLPLEELNIRLGFSIPLFLTPPECGTFNAFAEVRDWSHPLLSLHIDGEYTIDSGPGGGPCSGPSGNEPSGSTQTQPPIPAPPTTAPRPAPRPVVKLLRHPPHRSHDRTPSFRFTSNVSGSTFKCKLDGRPWHPCRSPLTLRKLSLGSHIFRVRAVGSIGEESAAASYRFVVTP
jgi:hypothetical protein